MRRLGADAAKGVQPRVVRARLALAAGADWPIADSHSVGRMRVARLLRLSRHRWVCGCVSGRLVGPRVHPVTGGVERRC